MFKYIIKITIRKLRKEFGYNLIIILSLIIGIVSSLFLLFYVFDDLSYDQYHKNKDRIVRVASHIIQPDNDFITGTTQIPFASQAKEDYPEIENFVRMMPLNRKIFIRDEVRLHNDDVYYSDSSIFKVFTYDLIEGDPATALTRPNTMVVTNSFSNKYFSGENPFGKTIRTSDGESFEITGIMKDVPKNSHLIFSALISKNSLPVETGTWDRFGCMSYLLLREGTDLMALQDKMRQMFDKYMAESFRQRNRRVEYLLEPLTDIYLKSDVEGYGVIKSGELKSVYLFSIVAFFMLFIASINYMNLATARSIRRVKEIGLRKIAGSQRWPLILQFLSESLILTLIALVFSIIIVTILLPSFNQIAGKSFDLHYLFNAQVVLTLVGIIIFIGIIGGSYPAIYLAGFDPVLVIKQETGAGKSNFIVRKILVVLQYTISLALIIITWIILKQVRYMQNQELGFATHNIITTWMFDWPERQQNSTFRNLLRENPDILHISGVQNMFGYPPNPSLMLVETSEGMQQRTVNNYAVDYDFIKTLDIEIIQGRDFSREFASDTLSSVIINEKMADHFNWDEPLGKRLAFVRGNYNPYRVVGVMKDCHHQGLYSPTEPMLLLLWAGVGNNPISYIKVSDQNIQETLQFIENKWKEVFPGHPFEYKFLEDVFSEQYGEDERKGLIFTYFSILIILIACLGIFGLASFTVEQRTREVAIRKVLGAKIERILILIGREFLILVLISMIPAFIVAYYYMKDWLQDYPYPVEMGAWIFIGTAILAIILSLISVSHSIVKAGLVNPAESLRM